MRELRRRIALLEQAALDELLARGAESLSGSDLGHIWELLETIPVARDPHFFHDLYALMGELVGVDELASLVELNWPSLQPLSRENFAEVFQVPSTPMTLLPRLFWQPTTTNEDRFHLLQCSLGRLAKADEESWWFMAEALAVESASQLFVWEFVRKRVWDFFDWLPVTTAGSDDVIIVDDDG